MKKTLTLTGFAAMMLTTNAIKAQAPRYPLFEHFTQASCGPCAAQNPGFDTTILMANPDKVRHIAFHTSWPGVDPMNAHNPTEVQSRVDYYGVQGVPHVYLGGNFKDAMPGGFTQTDVDDYFSLGSPVKISVSEVDNGTTRDVSVDIKTVGTVPAGNNYVVRVAVVEDPINYTTAPGNNGEKHFPNVFRKMLPSSVGSAYTPAAQGSSVNFMYTYTEDPAWNTANLKVIAFLQDTVTKEVLNCGTVNDPTINYTLGNTGAASVLGTQGSASTFNFVSMNSGTATESFVYTLTTDAPGDWTSGFTVNSTPFTTSGTVSTASGATNTIALNVTPGASPFVATYMLTVSSTATPNSPVLTKKIYIISGVTDLIVHNTGGLGDGSGGTAANWANVYMGAMAASGEAGAGQTTDIILKELGATNSLGGVNNIYYNVGWTFPSLTDDELPNLQNFLNNGGNLFIAGQDLGWEIMDAASNYGTPANQAFFTGYLHAGWTADGGTANSSLKAVTTDAVFGAAANATISNFYGGAYFYPDELNTSNGALKIFTYASGTKIGGLRYQASNYKIVYLGVGPEMLSTTNANEVLDISHDWFYGLVSAEAVDFNHLFSVYPNPTSGLINIKGFEDYNTFQLFDLSGKLITSKNINANIQQIDLTALPAGTYSGRFVHEDGTSINQKVIIVK